MMETVAKIFLVYWIVGLILVANALLNDELLERFRRAEFYRRRMPFRERGLAFYISIFVSSVVWPRMLFRRRN